MMKIKKDAESTGTSDFYYDLFIGGYIDPEDFLEDPEDIARVNRAINVIRAYENALEDAGMIEEM